jgi:quinoprotein glucose dehydrogenase
MEPSRRDTTSRQAAIVTGPSMGAGRKAFAIRGLIRLNRASVQKLQVAWTFDTGDAFEGSEMQCNPIVVDGVLFATTPKLQSSL